MQHRVSARDMLVSMASGVVSASGGGCNVTVRSVGGIKIGPTTSVELASHSCASPMGFASVCEETTGVVLVLNGCEQGAGERMRNAKQDEGKRRRQRLRAGDAMRVAVKRRAMDCGDVARVRVVACVDWTGWYSMC